MDFDSRLWLFPVFVAPGLWLAWRLYAQPRRHYGLAAAYALAWILIGLLAVSPRWRFRSETWHAPLVVLAVDQSGSYAALGARAAAAASVRAARRHYEKLGFAVREIAFAQDLHREARARSDFPNLQAVIVWTDGRFRAPRSGDGEDEALSWPAPVFPVIVNPEGAEAQGERAELDFASEEGTQGAAVLTVEWRAVGAGGRADLALLAGSKVVWNTPLVPPAGTGSGERVVARLPLPEAVRSLALRGDPAQWRVLVRPAPGANRLRDNDTLTLSVRGKNLPARWMIRPLATLEERGLADALRAPGEARVLAVEPSALANLLSGTGGRDVVWIRAGSPGTASVRAIASRAGVPLIRYVPAADAARDGAESPAGFGPDARVAWRDDGSGFLPAGVLRLGDLGLADGERFRTHGIPEASLEALAWVEENGRRGLLFWRARGDGTFGCALPPLWRESFSSRVSRGSGASALSEQWVRGMSDWSRAAASPEHARTESGRSEPPLPELARLGNDLEALGRLAAGANGKTINSLGNDFDKITWPPLPGGQTRARSARAIPLAPPVFTALAIAALLAGVWALRKRFRLD